MSPEEAKEAGELAAKLTKLNSMLNNLTFINKTLVDAIVTIRWKDGSGQSMQTHNLSIQNLAAIRSSIIDERIAIIKKLDEM